ncbi:MAG: DUF4405 domain-containing protein [candidate division Zixibacteria bacterium]|nr:DUF4405 domain-containing protein [candidate division Zixibacteria bacterium]
MANSKKIHKRGLTSFFTLFGFLIMSVTGLILYVVPAGRIAYWTNWELIGLTKTEWDNIHILSSILFIVAGSFHIYFNWKPLMNYFKSKARKGVKLRRELSISLILSVWVIVSSIWLLPPLSYLLDFNEWIKTTWIVQDEYEPPFGHAELLSLKIFSRKMDIDLNKATLELRANGIVFESVDETLEIIAENNETSPMDLYFLIKKFEPAPKPEKLQTYTPESIEVKFSGAGIGNKSISAMCKKLGINDEEAISRLASVEVTATVDQTLKAVAKQVETEPIELMKVILIEGYRLPTGDK